MVALAAILTRLGSATAVGLVTVAYYALQTVFLLRDKLRRRGRK